MHPTNQAKTRRFRRGRLQPHADAALHAQCLGRGREIVELACAMLTEDAKAGGAAFVGENMPEPHLDTVPERAAKLAAYRFSEDFQSHNLGPGRTVAKILDAPSTHLFDGLTPRAQLIVPMTAALLANGGLGPVIGHVIHSDSGRTNRDQKLFGVHREDRVGPMERRIGLGNLAGDTLVPVTGHALVTGTRDDPATADADRAAEATRAARMWGFREYPSSIAEHVTMQLGILTATRQIIEQRGNSSRALYDAKIDPADLLKNGLSRWVLADRIEYGPRRSQKLLTGTLHEPGLDPEIIRAISDQGYLAMCRAADSLITPNPAQVDATNFEIRGHSMRGAEVIDALRAFDTQRIPGFVALSAAELQAVAAEAARLGIILPADLLAGVLPEGLRLLGGGKPATAVRTIVIATSDQTMVFTSNVNLEGPRRIEGVARAAMMSQSVLDPTWTTCVKRFYNDNNVYGEHSSTYHSRNALRLLKMLGNLISVAAARGALD